MLGVQDIRLDQFRSNVLALAKTAKVHNLPTVLTVSYAEGPNGPLMQELADLFPEVEVVYRPGPINSWDKELNTESCAAEVVLIARSRAAFSIDLFLVKT